MLLEFLMNSLQVFTTFYEQDWSLGFFRNFMNNIVALQVFTTYVLKISFD